jgi:hypothetical protein
MPYASSSGSDDHRLPTEAPDAGGGPSEGEELVEVVRVRRREGRRKKAKIIKNAVMVVFLVLVFVAMCFLFSWYQSERAGY